MSDRCSPTALLTEQQAAQFLGLSISTLQKRRFESKQPPYLKISRSVRYKLADLEAFAASCRINPGA